MRELELAAVGQNVAGQSAATSLGWGAAGGTGGGTGLLTHSPLQRGATVGSESETDEIPEPHQQVHVQTGRL